MKEIVNSPWNYTFIEHNGDYFLSVLCGTSAMYNVDIKLSDSELVQYEQTGVLFIGQLARNIQTAPSKYLDRVVEIPKS